MIIAKKSLIVACLILLMAAIFASAAPEGPSSITVKSNTRRIAPNPLTQNAMAGNLSTVIISGRTITQSWQGYAGNVTGTITLDDAYNNSLYDWSLTSPEGEVYATYLTTVDFSSGNVVCWNWSNTTTTYLQLAELEQTPSAGDGTPSTFGGMGAGAADVDGVSETFNWSDIADSASMSMRPHTAFYVGSYLINGTLLNNSVYMRHPPIASGGMGPCPNTRLLNNTADMGNISVYSPTSDLRFEEILLYYRANAGNGDGVIFTSLLKNDQKGYNNITWDFEMIVPEDGHAGNTASTTYYFYVELE